MRTIGLGGDSDVRQAPEDPDINLRLGPRRVVPVSLLAAQSPDEVHAALDRQLALPNAAEERGRFALASGRGGAAEWPEGSLEAEMLAALDNGPMPLDRLLTTRRHRTAMARLQGRGAVALAGFCPSDAAHVLGLHRGWDRDAAVKAATLLARRRTARGDELAADAEAISRAVVDRLVWRSAETLIDAAFAEDGDATERPSAHPLVQAAMAKRAGLVRLDMRLTVPIVALGASAPTYYGAVAALLSAEAVIPAHADVANAIGAVVGHVRVQARATISRPADGLYRAHVEDRPADFAELADAVAHAEAAVREAAMAGALRNGAANAEVAVARSENVVTIGEQPLFLGMTVTATAVGRPSAAMSKHRFPGPPS